MSAPRSKMLPWLRRSASPAGLLIALLLGGCTQVVTGAADRVTVDTPSSMEGGARTAGDKWSLWTGPTRLRGANLYQRRVYPELDGDEFLGPGPAGPPYVQEDLDQLAAMGANYVNISHPGLFAESPPFALDEEIAANLDRLLAMAARADLFAVISFRTGPGRSDFTFYWDGAGDWFDRSYLNDSMWQDADAQEAWVAMWRFTAERYRDHPVVAGYDLMVEPNSNEVGSHALDDPLDIWDPQDFYEQFGGTLYDWNQLYPRLSAAIRQVDTQTPILIGGMGYSAIDWLPFLQPTGDPRTVYTVHAYAPHAYTHQEADAITCTYPGDCDLDGDGLPETLDQSWLEQLYRSADSFVAEHGAPLAANEFGVMRWVPGSARFLADQMVLLEARGMNHALWVWDPSWLPWVQQVDDFDPRHGPDADNHTDVESSELLDVIRASWALNVVRPSDWITSSSYLPIVATASLEAEPLPLDRVRFWAYQLQDLSAPGAVDALVNSRYDLLVLEPTRTDWSPADRIFDTRAMVTRLKGSWASDGQHRKQVLAYINIGEAEDWRWYWTWSTGWTCWGPIPADWPDYILDCDPDGWAGNYPVAYWDEGWKDLIIYGQNQTVIPDRDYRSALDEALLDGFDGVYLDWVEGYENEDVVAEAGAAGLDPAQMMIAFVAEIRAYARARNPDFVVVQQNAAALLEGHPELASVIDAIAQEAVWFDGDAGDDWDDPDGYDLPQDADLTGEYLSHLAGYQVAGLPVFNCEYALEDAAGAYALSYAQGLVPYVTRTSLARLTTTPPPGYEP